MANDSNPTSYDFPRLVSREDVLWLMRCFVSQSEEPDEKDEFRVQLHVKHTTNLSTGEKANIFDFREGPDTIEISGNATLVGKMQSTSFYFEREIDSLERSMFKGIRFNVTPGYRPGELNSDSLYVMRRIMEYSKVYFEAEKR